MDTAHFQSTCQSVVDVSRKIVDVTVGAVSWTSYYFHGASYLYDKQSWLARLGNVAGIFSEMNSELAISRKDRYFFPMKKSFWERNKIMKSLYSPPLWTYWTTSQWLLFWWICEAINECDVWILHNKNMSAFGRYAQLNEPVFSARQVFAKCTFKLQDKPMDSNIT